MKPARKKPKKQPPRLPAKPSSKSSSAKSGGPRQQDSGKKIKGRIKISRKGQKDQVLGEDPPSLTDETEFIPKEKLLKAAPKPKAPKRRSKRIPAKKSSSKRDRKSPKAKPAVGDKTIPLVATGAEGDQVFVEASAEDLAKMKGPAEYSKLCQDARPSTFKKLRAIVPKLSAEHNQDTRYSFDSLLGEGGMGRVLAVQDNDILRPIAMKILQPDMRQNTDVVERFLDEAQIAGQLEHPNILPVYDLDTTGEEPFFTMKLVEGDTLREIIDRLRRNDKQTQEEYTLVRRLQIFQQLCMGMAYAHQKCVVHRDLKPDNVMLGEFGEVLIMDWGLAMVVKNQVTAPKPRKPTAKLRADFIKEEVELLDSQKRLKRVTTSRFMTGRGTTQGTVQGTPVYMSPEQARGHLDQVRGTSDIYSLGVMLYELLTLQIPLRGKTSLETVLKVSTETPIKPTEMGKKHGIEVPPFFDPIVMKALEKTAEDRYQDAEEFADAVQGFIDGSLERERRRAEAAKHVQRGYEHTRSYFRIRTEKEQQGQKLKALQESIPPYAPLSEKKQLFEMEDHIERLEQDQARVYEAAHDSFDAALGVIPDDPAAREAKSDLFWEFFLEAEKAGDKAGARHFRARVEAFHDGKYRDKLEFSGRVLLELTPWPDVVQLSRLEEREYRLQVQETVTLARQQSVMEGLRPGPYLLTAHKQGYASLRRPLEIRRAKDLKIHHILLSQSYVPDGFVVIAGGISRLGGDLEAPSSLPRMREEIEEFLLAEYPVTAGQYLQFINALAAVSLDQAYARVPRERANTEPLWKPDSRNRFSLENAQFQGLAWQPQWPIFGVSYSDAAEYCRWLSRSSNVNVRLPTEKEWEWAARGPSALLYPWGSRFDPSFCKMRSSRPGFPKPEAIGSYPIDCSLFGVRDMAGGVHEWCTSAFDEERGMISLRGGSWVSRAERCRAAARIGDQPYDRHLSYGFRLARDLPMTVDLGL